MAAGPAGPAPAQACARALESVELGAGPTPRDPLVVAPRFRHPAIAHHQEEARGGNRGEASRDRHGDGTPGRAGAGGPRMPLEERVPGHGPVMAARLAAGSPKKTTRGNAMRIMCGYSTISSTAPACEPRRVLTTPSPP